MQRPTVAGRVRRQRTRQASDSTAEDGGHADQGRRGGEGHGAQLNASFNGTVRRNFSRTQVDRAFKGKGEMKNYL